MTQHDHINLVKIWLKPVPALTTTVTSFTRWADQVHIEEELSPAQKQDLCKVEDQFGVLNDAQAASLGPGGMPP